MKYKNLLIIGSLLTIICILAIKFIFFPKIPINNPETTEVVVALINDSLDNAFELIPGETYHELYLREHEKHNTIRSFDLSKGTATEIPVLMYHHMLLDEENNFKNNSAIIAVEQFYLQMQALYKGGYTTLTLSELEKWLAGEIEVPKRSVVLTFDDGYLSNYIYAYPILKSFGFRAAQFLITNTTMEESQGFDPNKLLQYLSWEDIVRTLDVFEYSNHTHDLHHLENGKGYMVTKPLDIVKEDIAKNMFLTGSRYFAYPYGHYNDEVLELLEEAGISMAFTVNEGFVKRGDSLLELKRFGIFPKTSLEAFNSIVRNN